jgi:hypothetical protein
MNAMGTSSSKMAVDWPPQKRFLLRIIATSTGLFRPLPSGKRLVLPWLQEIIIKAIAIVVKKYFIKSKNSS